MGQMPNICPLCFAALSLRAVSEAVDLNWLLLLLGLLFAGDLHSKKCVSSTKKKKKSAFPLFFSGKLTTYRLLYLLSSLFPFLRLLAETRSIRQVLTVDAVTCRSLSFLQPPALLLPYPEEPDCLTSHQSLCNTHHSSYPVA